MNNLTFLTCGRCGKPFEKASTLKRHGYYCRSRQPGQGSSKKRSCVSCSRAKTKCDWKLPSCSTCKRKQVNCAYEDGALSNIHRSSSSTLENVMNGTSQEKPVNDSDKNSIINHVSPPDEAIASFESTFTQPEQTCSALIDQDLGLAAMQSFSLDIDSTRADMTALDFSSPKEAQLDSSGKITDNSILVNENISYTLLPLHFKDYASPALPLKYSSRTLMRRELAKPGYHISAILLFQILGSFPSMMLRWETLPPFIHPTFHPKNFSSMGIDQSGVFEALFNCISISHLFRSRTKDSKFVWRSIRLEHERIWHNYNNFINCELLCAAYSLVIYTLMRIVDGETEHNDFDIPLMISLNAVTNTLSLRLGGSELHEALDDREHDWQDWVFYESRRRVITVVRIMNMLVNFDQAITCLPPPGFAIIPLPAQKTVWEAKTAAEWRSEYENTLQSREIFGLSDEGQLIKLQQRFGQITTHSAKWEEWYSVSDRFGTLIMIAASLL